MGDAHCHPPRLDSGTHLPAPLCRKETPTSETVKGVVEAVPVYQDLAQGAVQEVGKALTTIAKLSHIVVAPATFAVWTYEQAVDFFKARLSEKMALTPPDQIVPPKGYIAGPALEALRWTGDEESLREMYANLLATSMDARTANNAHPSFVEIIKQLTPDEAKLITYINDESFRPVVTLSVDNRDKSIGGVEFLVHFSMIGEKSGCEHPYQTPQYLGNLTRLGLVVIPEDKFYTKEGVYDEIENHLIINHVKKTVVLKEDQHIGITRQLVNITPLGSQFINSCVSYDPKPE
jgi:hypothetical protein